LERSHFDVELRAAGNIFLLFAPIVFVTNLGIFLLTRLGMSTLWLTMSAVAIFCVLMGVLFWHPWWRIRLTSGPAKRLFGSIVLANIVGTLLVPILCRPFIDSEQALSALVQYPFATLLAGVMFFSLGSDFWGRLYLIGVAYFVVAVLMTWNLAWAPLEFGILMGLTAVIAGLRLRALGNLNAGDDAIDAPTPRSSRDERR
jgi:hypothetical protein